jgi:hypothetical protein
MQGSSSNDAHMEPSNENEHEETSTEEGYMFVNIHHLSKDRVMIEGDHGTVRIVDKRGPRCHILDDIESDQLRTCVSCGNIG